MFHLKHEKFHGKAPGEKNNFESKLFLVSMKTAHFNALCKSLDPSIIFPKISKELSFCTFFVKQLFSRISESPKFIWTLSASSFIVFIGEHMTNNNKSFNKIFRNVASNNSSQNLKLFLFLEVDEQFKK